MVNIRESLFLGVLCGALWLPAGFGCADVLSQGAVKHAGVLEGYSDRQFQFRTVEGRVLQVKRIFVRSITLDAPVDVRFTRTGQSAQESGRLLGYDGSKFTIEQAGRKRDLLGGNVESLAVQRPAPAPAQRAADPGVAPAAIDISGVDGRDDLSPAQTAALQKYKDARRRFEAFVAENAALVKQMDAATGARRMKLLDTLRQRKGDEPPLRAALQTAEAALLAAFPQEPPAPEAPAPRNAP